MLKQVIRKGDVVVFSRAHEHPKGDTRSFLVEEVVLPGSKLSMPSTIDHARISPIDHQGDVENGWQLRPVDALKHDPHVALFKHRTFIEAVVAPGFLGNPDQWCWWESEYPEDGAIGGYPSRERALAAITENEIDNKDTCHFHVSELVEETYRDKRPIDLAKKDPRRHGVCDWRSRAERRSTRINADHRRFFTVNYVSTRADENLERRYKLRIALIGIEPFRDLPHHLFVEELDTDSKGQESWRLTSGRRADQAVYWLVRRLLAGGMPDADRFIGTITETLGIPVAPHYSYSFTPSEDQ